MQGEKLRLEKGTELSKKKIMKLKVKQQNGK